MSDADGIALTCVAHPKAAWYKRLWFWLRRPRLSPDSLESIEIEMREPPQDTKIRVLDVLNAQAMRDRDNYYNRKAEKRMDDREIEKEIQAKGLTAPRVSLNDIETCIAWEYYTTGDRAFGSTTPVIGPAYKAIQYADITPLRRLTLCVLHLKNGFIVTGESVCVSEENFDEAIGRMLAREDAIDKVWMLEGYRLKQHLYDHEGRKGT